MRQCRLIYDPPTPGHLNMAVDEALLAAVCQGTCGPVLRFYAWSPPCVSLGYGQPWTDADLNRIAAAGWDVVRRPTGGRAILHIDELTYSIALPAGHPLAQGRIVESYRRISQALLVGLNRLGVQSSADRRAEDAPDAGPICFELPSHYEITAQNGRKLIGSAQTRRRGGVLQHGSLPLYGDLGRICDGLAYPDESARSDARALVRRRAITLEEALGTRPDWATVADTIVLGFIETFDMDFVDSQLTAAECQVAQHLAEDVYSSVSHLKRY